MSDNTQETPTNIAGERLRPIVERIERLEEERKALGNDIKDIYSEAKSAGFDVKVIPDVPKVPAVKQSKEERVVILADGERLALLEAYNPSARRVMTALAYQGMRTGEALNLKWRFVDFTRRAITIAHLGRQSETRTKSGKSRTVPMHPIVYDMLVEMKAEHDARLAEAALKNLGRVVTDHVFLSTRGNPYSDTRGKDGTGGNPLAQAHDTACKNVGVIDFRPHDWRHDWAARMVMAGVDLFTLMKLGGWSDLRMVQRYASVSVEHLREAILKIA